MGLTIKEITIKDIHFIEQKDQERIEKNVLYLSKKKLKEHLMEDKRILSCEIDRALPGESIRILPVKDVIEPRAKEDGDCFPGIDGDLLEAGKGTTICLKQCAVVTTGSIVGFQEGIIDMSGPLTEYTPFSQLNNIVLILEKQEHVDQHDHEAMVREAGIKAAHYIGKLGRGISPTSTKEMNWEDIPTRANHFPELPKVVYIYLCMAQGLLHDTFFYGKNAQGISPSLISPLEVVDGALVSGNCVSPGSKNTTYHHQNNPLLQELLDAHGKEINFMGIVLSPLMTTLADKRRHAIHSVKLATMLGAQGAIVSQEGFGNPTTDLMMVCEGLEKNDIDTVIISNEDAGVDGYSESLPDGTDRADAIISTGNSNATLELPAMDRVLGDLKAIERVTGGFVGSIQPDGGLVIEIHGIMGSHNLLGMTKLSAITK